MDGYCEEIPFDRNDDKLPGMTYNLEVYKKREGTSDYGKQFEYLMCAYYSLKFITNQAISDFELYTNHKSCGDFDDVVLKVKFIDGSVKLFLLQLKHFETRKKFVLSSLTTEKGDFSLFKYQQSFQCINLEDFNRFSEEKFDVYLILYTNKCSTFTNTSTLKLKQQNYHIKQHTNGVCEDLLNTNENGNSIFKIENIQSCSSEEIQQFFKHFYLYTDQKGHQEIKNSIHEILKQISDIDEMFINFFKKWWEGKFILTKQDVLMKLSELVFSPSIKIISNEKCSNKSKLIEKAIMKFDVTVVEKFEGDDIVEKIWNESTCETKEMLKIIKKYGLVDRKICQVKELTPEEKNKALWYLDKIPLIIEIDKLNKNQIKAAILLLEQHKIKKKLVLKSGIEEMYNFNDFKILKNLFCLKNEEKELYQDIVRNFEISLQGHGTIPLENLIGNNEDYAEILRIKDLFRVLSCESRYNVEENIEVLPIDYIPRTVSTTFLNANTVLQKSVLKENLFIIMDHDNANFTRIGDLLRQRKIEIKEISDFLDQNECKQLTEEEDEFVILQNEKCTMKQFREFSSKMNCNVCLLKIFNVDWFMLIASKGIPKNLKQVELGDSPQIDETNIHSVFDGPLNFICAEPGMGKSTTMKYLKNTTPSDFWTVFVELKTYNSFFKIRQSAEDVLNLFLNIEHETGDKFLYNVKSILLKRNKIMFFFDGLDEMEQVCIHNVLNSIKEISSLGFQVWISARENLQEKVENKLKIFSIHITELNKHQQKGYIITRLGDIYTSDEIDEIFEKISNSVNISNNNKILGIPLQLYMITQIFLDDRQHYLELNEKMFVLTEMYRIHLKGNIKHALRKSGCSKDNLIERISMSELEKYIIPALKSCLNENDFKTLNLDSRDISQSEDFLDFIRKNGDDFGIIKRVDEGKRAVYVHQTHAEYFACVFLSTNFEKARLLKDRLFSEDYVNLKLLLDLELGVDSPLHLSIIYRNIESIEKCIKNFQMVKDKGGRSPLHLICSYATKYPPLKRFGKSFYLEPDIIIIQENLLLQEIIMKLIELYSTSLMEKDNLCKLNVVEYASLSYNLFSAEVILQKFPGSDYILTKIFEIYSEAAIAYYATKFAFHNLLSAVLSPHFPIKYISYGDANNSLLHVGSESEHDNIEIIKRLLDNNIEIDIKNKHGRTPLYLALRHRRNEVVKLLISEGADVNCVTDNGRTALHDACIEENYKLIDYLLKHNINSEREDKYGKTAMYYAARFEKIEVVKLLIRNGVNINCTTSDGRTALYEACIEGNCELIEYLLSHKIDSSVRDRSGKTALYLAARKGRTDVVKLLIAKGVDVNSMTADGQTVLHGAATAGNNDLVKYLLNFKIDINIEDVHKKSALYLAVRNGKSNVVKLLTTKGANVHCVTDEGRSPLHGACLGGDNDLIIYLLKYNINLDIKDKYGETVLYYATRDGRNNVVKLLVSKGADVNCIRNDGQTVLHEACIKGNYELVEFIINHDVNLNAKNIRGETALFLATRHRRNDIVKLLINKGADVNCITNDGKTVLHGACLRRNLELVKYLLSCNIDATIKDNNGNTALHYAAFDDNMVKILSENLQN